MQQPPAGDSYAAPNLKISEIISCLSGIGIKIVADDIAKPTPERTREIFSALVSLLYMCDTNTCAPKFAATSHIEHPELYDEAYPEIVFMTNLTQLMRVVGVHFSYHRDMVTPTTKFLRGALSATINFLKFREERLERVKDRISLVEEYDKQIMEAEAEIERLNHERNALRLERERDEPIVKTLEVETAQLQGTLDALNKTQLQLKNDSHGVKQATQGVLDQAAAVKFELLNLRQENGKLKAQIVPAPDKMKKMIEEMATALENEKRHIEDLEKNAQTLRARTEAISKFHKEVVRMVAALEEVEGERSKLKEAKAQIRDLKAKAALAEQKMRDLNDKAVALRRQLQTSQEKLTRHQKRAAEKRQQAQAALEEARCEKQVAESEANAQLKSAIDQENANAKSLQARMSEATREHDATVAALREKLEGLMVHVQTYHLKLEAAMNAGPAISTR